MNTIARRSITLPVLLIATAIMTLALPLWLPVSFVFGLFVRSARSAPRVLLFIAAYLWCETIGVLTAGLIWLRFLGRSTDSTQGPSEDRAAWYAANYALQDWWCRSLKWWAQTLFRLRFSVEGDEALIGDGALMMLRHCSIGDTVIPVVFYNHVHDKRLRFVLKRELLFDPCLDIVGNRLPNYFADRSSQNTAREVEGVKSLLSDLPKDSGVLIYPEGTRFTPDKRAQLIERLREKGEVEACARAERWAHVLPPRPGGALALLDANPGRDLILGAHTGFEGSADFARLFNGSWLDTHVRIRFWRVPFAELPIDPEARAQFLFDAWDRMNANVAELVEGRS